VVVVVLVVTVMEVVLVRVDVLVVVEVSLTVLVVVEVTLAVVDEVDVTDAVLVDVVVVEVVEVMICGEHACSGRGDMSEPLQGSPLPYIRSLRQQYMGSPLRMPHHSHTFAESVQPPAVKHSWWYLSRRVVVVVNVPSNFGEQACSGNGDISAR